MMVYCSIINGSRKENGRFFVEKLGKNLRYRENRTFSTNRVFPHPHIDFGRFCDNSLPSFPASSRLLPSVNTSSQVIGAVIFFSILRLSRYVAVSSAAGHAKRSETGECFLRKSLAIRRASLP